MKITLEEIEQVLYILFSNAREMGVTHIYVTDHNNFYWEVVPKDLFKENERPSELGLGSLQEDWERLNDLLEKPEYAVTPAFWWVSGLLRALAVQDPLHSEGDDRGCRD